MCTSWGRTRHRCTVPGICTLGAHLDKVAPIVVADRGVSYAHPVQVADNRLQAILVDLVGKDKA